MRTGPRGVSISFLVFFLFFNFSQPRVRPGETKKQHNDGAFWCGGGGVVWDRVQRDSLDEGVVLSELDPGGPGTHRSSGAWGILLIFEMEKEKKESASKRTEIFQSCCPFSFKEGMWVFLPTRGCVLSCGRSATTRSLIGRGLSSKSTAVCRLVS